MFVDAGAEAGGVFRLLLFELGYAPRTRAALSEVVSRGGFSVLPTFLLVLLLSLENLCLSSAMLTLRPANSGFGAADPLGGSVIALFF